MIFESSSTKKRINIKFYEKNLSIGSGAIIMQLRKIFGLFCFICISQLGKNALPAIEPDSLINTGYGILNVTSTTCSINVYLNSKYIGVTPIRSLRVPAGLHQLSTSDASSAVWRNSLPARTFQIAVGESLQIEPIPDSQYYINSQPFDAQVIYNGQYIGRTPLFFTFSDTNNGLLILRKQGYLDYVIRPGKNAIRFFDIKLVENKQPEEDKIQISGYLQNRQKRKKLLAWSMVGVTIVSGLTSIYFHREADRRYERYLAIGHPDDMNRLYDQTQHYDNLAAASYGVFQISFITALYLLLFKK